MAAVTICSDFGAQKNKVRHCFHCLPIFPMKWWDRMPWSYIQIQFNVYNFCNQTLSQNILWGVLHIIKHSSNTILMVLRKSIIWVTIFNLSPWSEVKVSQSCPTLCDSMDYMVHRILQARILEWVAFSFSRVSSYPGTEPGPPSLQEDSSYPSPLTLLTTHVYVHIYWLRVNPWTLNARIK